jgi:hypothetical protein
VREAVNQVWTAAMQVTQAGSTTQVEQAVRLLNTTRQKLYRILAGDDPDSV